MMISTSECIPIEYIKDQIEEYRKFDHLGMYAEFLDMFIQDYKDNAMANYADRKTEPQSCETCRHWQIRKDIYDLDDAYCELFYDNAPCKYEPQTEPQRDADVNEVIAKALIHMAIDNADIAEDAYPNLRQRLHDAIEDEPQTDWKDQMWKEACREEADRLLETQMEDEPQTERSE